METAFLRKICNVVERLVEEEWRVLRLMSGSIVAAAVANHYVNVAVANAGLRTHAAVHRLVDARVPPDTGRSAVGELCGDPAVDLRVLAELRKSAFMTRLDETVGVEDWWPTTTSVKGRLDRDEEAARKIISEEVDRVVKKHSRAVRKNMQNCDLPTLARFGAVLGQEHSRSVATHRAVLDALTDQLWTSAVDSASHQLAERVAVISPLTVDEASRRISHWIGKLSRSTAIEVRAHTVT